MPNVILIQNPCASTCDAVSSYTLRFRNTVNKLTTSPYNGTLTIQTMIDNATLIGQTVFSMNTISSLVPGVLQNVSVTRSINIQGQPGSFSFNFTTPGYMLDNSIVELMLP